MSPLKLPQDVIDEALRALGGDGIVIVEDDHGAEFRYANSMITTNGIRTDRSVTVISIQDTATGVCAGMASQQGTSDVDQLANKARDGALDAGPAEDAFVIMEGSPTPEWTTPPPHSSLDDLVPLFDAIGTACKKTEQSTFQLFGFVERSTASTYLGLSTGLRRRHIQTTGALHVVGRSSDAKRSAWAGRGGNTFSASDFDSLLAEVEVGLVHQKQHIPIEAGRHEVILTPSCVTDLMIDLVERASGRDAEEGQNVFSKGNGKTRLGEKLSSLHLNLYSDPMDRELSCIPFLATSASSTDVSVFDNGVPLDRTDWIKDGILGRLRFHRQGAKKNGGEFGSPIDNLKMEIVNASKSLSEMIASTKRGLLVNCLWYIREVDPVTLLLTGLTRDGVYVIENGQILGSTTNFRFNESPVDLLARATEASVPYRSLGREFGEWENRTSMPALRIPDFHMSSVSEAL